MARAAATAGKAGGRRLLVLWAGRHQRPEWQTLCADYRQRIERDMPVEDRMIKAGGGGNDPGRMDAEGAALLAALPDPCWSIALDPRAKVTSTEDLAKELQRLRREWPHPIAFLVGSDLGLSEAVLRGVRKRISFGKMVFGHELALRSSDLKMLVQRENLWARLSFLEEVDLDLLYPSDNRELSLLRSIIQEHNSNTFRFLKATVTKCSPWPQQYHPEKSINP